MSRHSWCLCSAYLFMLFFRLCCCSCCLVVHLLVKQMFLGMPVLSLHIIQIAGVHRVHCVLKLSFLDSLRHQPCCHVVKKSKAPVLAVVLGLHVNQGECELNLMGKVWFTEQLGSWDVRGSLAQVTNCVRYHGTLNRRSSIMDVTFGLRLS